MIANPNPESYNEPGKAPTVTIEKTDGDTQKFQCGGAAVFRQPVSAGNSLNIILHGQLASMTAKYAIGLEYGTDFVRPLIINAANKYNISI